MRMPAPCPTLLRRRPRRGFTLIEAMIVVAVVAILAAVALPSFMDSIRKGRRSDAFAAISQVQQAQERWRANHASYADQLSTAPPDGLGLNATTDYYTIALSDVGAAGYTVTASARSGTTQAGDSACQKLVLTLTGGNLKYSSVDAGNVTDTEGKRCWAK